MTKKTLISEILLLLTTMIWGTAFVFQDMAMDYVCPITFNVARTIVGGIFLVAAYFIIKPIKNKTIKEEDKKEYKPKDLIIGSLVCGAFLGIAMIFQQIGITTEGAGKSGFITALYIIFVPVFGLFFKRKVNVLVWVGVAISIGGLILINYSDGQICFGVGSLWLLGCALAFTFQILAVDYFSKKCDAMLLTAGQLFGAFIINFPLMFIFEQPNITSILACWGPILFCGVCSSGIAYCLQTFTQANIQPTIASLLMSMESVFSVLADIIILHSVYGGLELLGCGLIFIAVVIAQIPLKEIINNHKNKKISE